MSKSRKSRRARAARFVAAVAAVGAFGLAASAEALSYSNSDESQWKAIQSGEEFAGTKLAAGKAEPAKSAYAKDGSWFPIQDEAAVRLIASEFDKNKGDETGKTGPIFATVAIDLRVVSKEICFGFDYLIHVDGEPRGPLPDPRDPTVIAQVDRNEWRYSESGPDAPGDFARTREIPPEEQGAMRAQTPVEPGDHTVYVTVIDPEGDPEEAAAMLAGMRVEKIPVPGECKPLPQVPDRDRDALRDSWEDQGATIQGERIDLPAMGANPDHRDLFLEIDYMRNHQLQQAAVTAVAQSFAGAPVQNPDGETGINLHADNGRNSVMDTTTGATWGDLSRSNRVAHDSVLGSFDASGNYVWDEFDAIKNANFPAERRGVFRYALSAHRYGTNANGSTGLARGIPASDLIVSLGRFVAVGGVNVDQTSNFNGQTGTLMHEFGHTVNLSHGGNEGTNYKPNYLSVMNYTYQFGLNNAGATVFDYSRFDTTTAAGTVTSLNESSLNEPTGITATGAARNFRFLHGCHGDATATALQGPFRMNRAVDWNCDGDSVDVAASTSINKGTALNVLNPHEDWTKLRYSGGRIGIPGGGADLPGVTEVTDDISDETLIGFAARLNGDSAAPAVRIVRARLDAKRDRVTVVASDSGGVDRLIVDAAGQSTAVEPPPTGCAETILQKSGVCHPDKIERRTSLTTTVVVGRGQKVGVVAVDRIGNKKLTSR